MSNQTTRDFLYAVKQNGYIRREQDFKIDNEKSPVLLAIKDLEKGMEEAFARNSESLTAIQKGLEQLEAASRQFSAKDGFSMFTGVAASVLMTMFLSILKAARFYRTARMGIIIQIDNYPHILLQKMCF